MISLLPYRLVNNSYRYFKYSENNNEGTRGALLEFMGRELHLLLLIYISAFQKSNSSSKIAEGSEKS
jgi:hypothetical protein